METKWEKGDWVEFIQEDSFNELKFEIGDKYQLAENSIIPSPDGNNLVRIQTKSEKSNNPYSVVYQSRVKYIGKNITPPLPAKVEVFPNIFVGDIVVSLQPWDIVGIEKNDILKVLQESKKYELRPLADRPNSFSQPEYWRKATMEEEHAYHQGIRNIKNIKQAPCPPKETTTLKNSKYWKCIKLWGGFTKDRIYQCKKHDIIGYNSPIDDNGLIRDAVISTWTENFEPSTEEEWIKQNNIVRSVEYVPPVVENPKDKWKVGLWVKNTGAKAYSNVIRKDHYGQIINLDNSCVTISSYLNNGEIHNQYVSYNLREAEEDLTIIGMESPFKKGILAETSKEPENNLQFDHGGVHITLPSEVIPIKNELAEYEQTPAIIKQKNKKISLITI